ncbi:MAG TPA: ABC transporter permease, partial [Thermomicrobiales bacterium]|nr:ABC transporter permease [Thermomicrobiales bacterium]
DALRRFARNKVAVAGALIVALLLLIAIVGPMLSPYDYARQDYLAVNLPPSSHHWLGTDALGRDYMTRVMMGGRTAFLLSIWVVAITTILGALLGAASGFFGGWVDAIIMRIGDTFMAFPQLLLALFCAGAIRPPVAKWLANYRFFQSNSYLVDYAIVFGALSVVGWSGMARLMRAQIMMLRRQEYVTASESVGASNWRILSRHLLPNAMSTVVVSATASIANVMVLESSLSFLGIGVRPPAASWGSMIGENLTTWQHSPHLLAAPAIVLAIAALAFNFIGDGLNDALDPRRQT